MNPHVLATAALAALAVAAVLTPPAGSRLPRGTLVPIRRDVTNETSVPRVPVTAAAAAGAGVVVALLIGSGIGVALGVVAVPVAWRWLSRLEPAAARRHREQLESGVPLLVDLLAACLRAGHAPGTALAAVTASLEPGPLRTETASVVARLRLGGDPLGTWRALGGHPQLGALGRTVARALDGGASVADAMGDLAHELRRTRRAEVQARARSVGARAAAPLGLCLLPAFVLVGIVPVVAGSLGALLER